MKPWRSAFTIIGLLLLALPATAAQLHPRPAFTLRAQSKLPEVLDKVDASLAAVWPMIEDKESNYAAAFRGARFWQALSTHAAPPEDGTEKKPDVASKTPTDQPDPWPASVLNADLPMALSVDIYDGPYGTGYVVNVVAVVEKSTWMRTFNTGPETWRTEGWHELDP